MEVKGTVLRKLSVETGTSKAGKEWKKQSIVIDLFKRIQWKIFPQYRWLFFH
jgi:hypothetical protein